MFSRLALGLLIAAVVLLLAWSLEGPPAVELTYRAVNESGVGEFTITNHGSKPVTDWSVSFRFPEEIQRIWGATLASDNENRYTIRPEARTRTIPAAGTIVVGFQAKSGNHLPSHLGFRPFFGVFRPESPDSTPGTSLAMPGPERPPLKAPPTLAYPNYAEALQMSLYFYEAQRSGKLPPDNRVAWRKDSGLKDGADVGVDLTGGYYDAGDHVKFTLPLCSALTVLAWGGAEYKAGYVRSGQWNQFLATLRWGTDWLMKAHSAPNELYAQVGEGEADHAFWGPPEAMTMPRRSFKITQTAPGSDLAGEAAAALASAAVVFRNEDPAYAKLLVAHAEQLFSFAMQYQGKYSDSVPQARTFYESQGYWDELTWAAAWMYSATGQQAYLTQAEALYQRHLLGNFHPSTLNWNDKMPGVAVLLARLTRKAEYRQDSEAFLDFWTEGYDGRRISYSSGGLAWLTNWGALRYTATTAFLALVYSDTVDTKRISYRNFAVQQINYILGENPAERSYIVGFGNNPPVNPHHRGAHGSPNGDINNPAKNTHILYGALVGGPKQPDDFSYVDDRTDEHGNEVALDYNAGLTGALARLVMAYGGKPLDGFPPAENP